MGGEIMKTMTITDIMADFLDSIRAYEHESGEAIHFDERESSEFVDMYFNNAKQEGIELTEKLINIIMKKYKLKQWYPSLPKEWKDKRGIVSFNTNRNGYNMEGVDGITWIIGVHEFSNKDFWELIEEKKPLLITEDGVEIFEGDRFIMVGDDFVKHKRTAFNLPCTQDYKKFKHESNADEYILWNKPLLNLKDIEVVIKGYLPEFVELIKLAEERVK